MTTNTGVTGGARTIEMICRRTAGFLIDQTRKTLRRPSRVFVILYGLAKTVLMRGLSKLIMRRLPAANSWVSISRGIVPEQLYEDVQFLKALELLQKNRPREASIHFANSLPSTKDPNKFFTAAINLLQGLGRFSEAMELFKQANSLHQKKVAEIGLARCSFLILDNFWASNYGHTAAIDYVVKMCMLEGRTSDQILFFLPDDRHIANRFWVEQWRPFLQIIEAEDESPIPRTAIKALSFDFLAPYLADGSTVHLWEIAAKAYRRWHESGRGSILRLPDEIEEKGRAQLESVGIPRTAWFVALHVREAGSKSHHVGLHNVLNATICDYYPAIHEITRRGGWVVRIGDPSMEPLDPMDRVLDYCHSRIRSDWMDVFLSASSRFFIGTSSGPAYVPPAYGVPCVLTNWWPPAQRPWHAADIFIPKRYREISSGKYLTLSESLVEPLGYCNSVDHLKETHGLIVEDNDSDDITAAVIEMIERVEGVAHYFEDDLARRARADDIFEKNAAFGLGVMAREFVRRNPHFLD